MEQPQVAVKLSELPDQPTYNVKAVCLRTGISSATLRAWERRYGVPSPYRTAHGYRLYSERDVATLHWLIAETGKGVNIGHAVQQLQQMLANGQELSVTIPPPQVLSGHFLPRSPETIITELAEGYAALSERQCNDLITEASAMYTLETIMLTILKGALGAIHEGIGRGETSAAVENFALNHVRHRLERTLQTTPLWHPKRCVMLIGFGSEGSELDLLILTILLRRAGHDTIYLVADFDADLLRSEVTALRATLIVFYSHAPDHVQMLSTLDNNGAITPMVYAGGAPTILSTLRETIPFEYIGDDLREIYRTLLERLRHVDTLEPDKV